MQSFKSNSGIQRLLDIEKILSFNQFDVHLIDEQTIRMVKEAGGLLDSINFSEYPTLQNQISSVVQKVCIYYAFLERHKELSLHFFNQLHSLVKPGSVQDACVTSLLGYANTIDPTYRDLTLFEKALTLFPRHMSLEDTKNNDFETLYPFVVKAMTFRYLGLMHHRQAIEDDKVKNIESAAVHTDAAFANIQSAIDLEIELEKRFWRALLSLAESLHIKGVMHLRCGENTKNRDDFENALEKFIQASEGEKIFCDKTGAPHFLLATTMQSLAKTYMYLGRHEEAIPILNTALALQEKLFKVRVHPDIAKTLHFKADVYADKKNYAQAVDAYLETLLMRKQITYRDTFMVDMTINALKKMFTQLAMTNAHLCFDKYKKVHEKLVKVDKEGELTKYCYKAMLELQDQLSAKSTSERVFTPVVDRKKEETAPLERKFEFK